MDRFYIKVSDDQIEWFFPKMKEPNSVQKKEIIESDVSWKRIIINTETSEFEIQFKNFQWQQGKIIRETFKEFTT